MSRKVYIGKNSSGKTTELLNNGELLITNDSNVKDDIKTEVKTSKLFQVVLEQVNKNLNLKEKVPSIQNDFQKILEDIFSSIKKEFNNNDYDSKTINNFIGDSLKFNWKKMSFLINGGIFKMGEIDKLGSGHQTYFLYKLLLKYATEDLKLIIDEPETNLHESLIKKIGKELSKIGDKSDIIVATHSPIFVMEFIKDLEEIILTKREGNVSEKNILKNFKWDNIIKKLDNLKLISDFINFKKNNWGKKKNINSPLEYLIDDLKPQAQKIDKNKLWNLIKFNYLEDLISGLFYDKIVIVEGPLDKMIVQKLLNNLDIFVIASYGKWYIPILSLIFKEFDIEVIAFHDDDTNNKIHKGTKINNIIKKCVDNQILLKNNLENVLYDGNTNIVQTIDKNDLPRINHDLDNDSDIFKRINQYIKKI